MQDFQGGLVSDRAKSATRHETEATKKEIPSVGSYGNSRRVFAIAAALVVVLPTASLAAVTAAQKCEGGKNDASGKYAACMAKAEKSLVQGGSLDSYDSAQLKCAEKYSGSWDKLEGAGSCPTTGDDSAIQGFVDACVQSVAEALGGGTLPPDVVTCNADLTTCDGDLVTCDGDLATCDGDLITCDGDLATCDGDLAACEANPAAMSMKTGQQTCYTAAGASTPCAGTGQDGEFQHGAPASFTNHGDGTITDNATGLMWEVLTDDGSISDKDTTYNWTNAIATKVAAVNAAILGGHDDWRLPNVKELETLKYFGAVSPATYPVYDTGCMAACTAATCSCTRVGNYWSSTTDENGTSTAWYVGFSGGGVTTTAAKSSSLYVRLVRGTVDTGYGVFALPRTGQTTAYGAGTDGDLERGAARAFTDNGDGTITDNLTGLMWEKKSNDGSIHDKDNTYTWSTGTNNMDGTIVTTFLADLNSAGGFAGHTDWRIPNQFELFSLVNHENANTATFSEFNNACTGGCTVTTCSCTRSYFHWSSTTFEAIPTAAWGVYFDYGYTGTDHKTDDSRSVRAVRAGS